MASEISDTLKKIPLISRVAYWSNQLKLPGLGGLTLYDLLSLYISGIIKGTFSTRAGSIAFSFFMAIFPFLLFVLNLIPFVWFIDDFQQELLNYFEELLPPQTSGLFQDIFFDIANNPRAGLLSFVFVLSIFLMSNGVNAIFTGFEFSYHTKINRTIIRQYIAAVGVAIIVAILLLIAVIATVYFSFVIDQFTSIGVVGDSLVLARYGRFAILIIVLILGISILYYFGTREGRKTRFLSPGSFFTTILIVLTTYLFSIYVENFSAYNKLYGSIGALLILMLYIWLNSNILLLGFELNGALYNLKRKSK
ncbi:serum resistance membrane protein BrkB-like protein [Psychroflexus torquis ATCC 700755]|uniref:Serum resistance membrane protein BrkB-like protein n=1 Tax=Psychroflexus torquis (strain ATCC 700755 / CIP 106069 / ACAM 623) TaxID=313595 RepID=K4IA01_PSYTT|nr:YihY/virulence factor BrkB family protein [Psychroflexus torquis]AFU67442.1 serum resistance membrane protein BrkB-like protein [Psychroflexus torquis ATCC 700755]